MESYTNEEFNELLNNTKNMVINSTKGRCYNDETVNRLTSIIMASVIKYGVDVIPITKMILKKVPILISSMSMYELKIRLNHLVGIDDYLSNDVKGCVTTDIAVINQKAHHAIHSVLITTEDTKNECDILERLTHEFNHLTTSLNGELKNNNNIFTVRNGIILTSANIKTGKENKFNLAIGEGFNQLQTLDLLESINKFKNYEIYDENFKEYISKINYKKDNYNSYHKEIETLTPIWNNNNFKENFDKNVLSGDIDNIFNDFNNALKSNTAFTRLSTAIDNLEKEKKSIKLANNLIKTYNNVKKPKMKKKV